MPTSLLPLVTERLTLRDYRLDDAPAVHRYMSDPEVTRYVSWHSHSLDQARENVAKKLEEAAREPRETYSLAMVRRSDGLLFGTCLLMSRNAEMTGLEVGYALAREAWGQGFASEAVRAMLDFGFGPLGAHRIFAFVSPENPPSGRVLEKLGFRLEGRLKKHLLKEGEWYDSVLYALLEEEWKPV